MKFPFPFYLDAPGLDIRVVLDPHLEHRGIVRNTGNPAIPSEGGREIALLEPDERVLLHEVLHRLVQTGPDYGFGFDGEVGPLSLEQEERLVQHVERGLWEMGWRWSFDRHFPA